MSATKRTAIRAGYILAFDGRGHRLLRDGVMVMEGDHILHVGPRFDGTVDETVDARDRIVTPGLITTHAHIAGSPLDRSFIEDRGSPQFWYSGLFEMLPVRSEAQDEAAGRACVDFSMAELLRGGVTTVMEIGGLGPYVVERGAHDGLVRCYFSPGQVDTCTGDLLREAKRRADDAQRPFTLHTSQSVVEFNEMLQRHGKTPVAWLEELGVLGENTVLGHALIIGGSSWTNYPAGDVGIMAEHGCTVAHAPWVFARRGVVMESFALYRTAGINVALGTDTNPQSVIEAMRWAAVCSKIVERNAQATTAAHAFDAATLGGAHALGREDLGRVAPGATADLVLWKASSWTMTPLRDPIKNIVYNATAEDVDRVYVGGRVVVDKGRVLAADEAKILADLQAGGDRMWPRMKQFDWAGRSADELSPLSYRGWE